MTTRPPRRDRPPSDECPDITHLTTHFLVTDSITKCSNNIVATITFAITDHNGSLIHTTIIIFCLATRQKQSIKINHLNNHKHVLQCADITSPNDFANESLKVVGSRARAHVRCDLIAGVVVCVSVVVCVQCGRNNMKVLSGPRPSLGAALFHLHLLEYFIKPSVERAPDSVPCRITDNDNSYRSIVVASLFQNMKTMVFSTRGLTFCYLI